MHDGDGTGFSKWTTATVLMVCACIVFFAGEPAAQAESVAQWAWMKGASSVGQAGTYGVFRTPAAGNTPGCRESHVTWTDDSGALWLFGGYGTDASGGTGQLNDLWKYEPSTGNWSWQKGSNAAGQTGIYGTLGTASEASTPGARYGAVSWRDSSNAFWMFGGYGKDGLGNYVHLSDLWKYDPSTGWWTWEDGPQWGNQSGTYGTREVEADTNRPGARLNAVSWMDAGGALWLFGGYGYDAENALGQLNDLWKYDPTSGNWTWMKGADYALAPAVYGTLGTPAEANTPGARTAAVAWTDPSGAFWLFGGTGRDRHGAINYLSDFWRFDPLSKCWTWKKGPNVVSQQGVYGVMGTAAAANAPGARDQATAWTDAAGSLWLFGGYGNDGSTGKGSLNDLWKFDRSTEYWTWMNGSSVAGGRGVYGVLGTPNTANTPGGRFRCGAWRASSGELWMFGGYGRDGSTGTGRCNDLWRLSAPGDTAAPQGSVVINGNRSVTNTTSVTLTLNWTDPGDSGVVRMKFSNDAVAWTAWEYPAVTKSWSLPSGDGHKTVRVMFRDKAGNNSVVYSDYIRLDTTPPTGSIIINGGASSTTNPVVSLGLTWGDGSGSGVRQMRFSIDGAHWSAWEPQSTPRSYTLPAVPLGYYTVRVQYLDGANNYSPVYNDYIKLVAP